VNASKPGKSMIPKIISILFALILWFHITTNGTFRHKVSLPVQYIGPSEGYIAASSIPEYVQVIVRGSGKDLFVFGLRNLKNSRQRYASVNLTRLTNGENVVSIDKSAIILATDRGIEVESIIYPDSAKFSVKIEKEIKRTVAVNIDSLTDYKVKNGYIVNGKPIPKPGFVLIQGPENVSQGINDVNAFFAKKITISLKDTVFNALLKVPQFVSVEPEQVEIYYRVEQLMKRSFSGVSVKLNGFPRRNRPKFSPDSLLVEVQGPQSIISSMEKQTIQATINYQKYVDSVEKGDNFIEPEIFLNEGITVISTHPDVIQFFTSNK